MPLGRTRWCMEMVGIGIGIGIQARVDCDPDSDSDIRYSCLLLYFRSSLSGAGPGTVRGAASVSERTPAQFPNQNPCPLPSVAAPLGDVTLEKSRIFMRHWVHHGAQSVAPLSIQLLQASSLRTRTKSCQSIEGRTLNRCGPSFGGCCPARRVSPARRQRHTPDGSIRGSGRRAPGEPLAGQASRESPPPVRVCLPSCFHRP